MSRFVSIAALASLAAGLLGPSVAPPARAQITAEQQFVSVAAATLDSFANDPPTMRFRERARFARAVFIVPEVLRGAFVFGATTGSGVLMVRDRDTGRWNGPAFYSIGGASFGLQVGADASALVLLVMTDRGLDSFYRSSFKLGADASISSGSEGSGIGGATTPTLSADILSYAKSKGGYLGISLDGTVVKVAEKSNETYYGGPVSLVDVLVKGEPRHPATTPLEQSLANLSR